MFQDGGDLLAVLADARRNAMDDRLIWCVAADGFQTTVSQRRGLILGGAWSPHFLRTSGAFGWEVPWTVCLRTPAIVTIDKAVSALSEWLQLMEAIAQSGESLLVVTREVSTELLHTFVVNSVKGTLSCCVIRDADSPSGWGSPATNIPWRFVSTPPNRKELLPRAAEGWVRRTATVLFPEPDSEWRSFATDITVISVGGENHDDQQDRLRFLVNAIQHE